MQCQQRSEEGVELRNWSYCQSGYWELNLGSSGRAVSVLTTEPPQTMVSCVLNSPSACSHEVMGFGSRCSVLAYVGGRVLAGARSTLCGLPVSQTASYISISPVLIYLGCSYFIVF